MLIDPSGSPDLLDSQASLSRGKSHVHQERGDAKTLNHLKTFVDNAQ
ncbi:MAG TPA: hypothetical protein VE989_05585 [Sphingomicrobium sp.]|jgi:hypothetical protein|nr:hypothetical protein [Sphingomicrobium sp.]